LQLQLRHAALPERFHERAAHTSCTSDWSRKRTSAFVGCTFTSTRVGGISMNR
jgi:hypothetical protein